MRRLAGFGSQQAANQLLLHLCTARQLPLSFRPERTMHFACLVPALADCRRWRDLALHTP